MQLISHKSQLLTLFYTITVATTIVVICAPTDAPETSDLEKNVASSVQEVASAVPSSESATNDASSSLSSSSSTPSAQHHMSIKAKKELDYEYYYKFRNVVGEGVKKALDECRQKFKWDRWNCPLKSFQSIMSQEDYPMGPMPSNKELGLTRALISSGIVLSIVHSCSVGTNSLCSCSNPITLPLHSAEMFLANGFVPPVQQVGPKMLAPTSNSMANEPVSYRSANQVRASISTTIPTLNDNNNNNNNHHHISSTRHNEDDQPLDDDESGEHNDDGEQHLRHHNSDQQNYNHPTMSNKVNKFAWAGCDEVVKLGFKVAQAYLNAPDLRSPDASQLINAHNFEVGRQAVKQTIKRRCKCHGTSGACQMKTCWTVVPDISEVGDYLKRQYRVAAKVGAVTAKETDTASLVKELSAIGPEKLVFADASPDYCYENKQLGINGTLGRYCSRTKHRLDGTEVSRSERDSCDRLCTKCGYKIKREKINVERQCDCRFVYCCSIECKRCPHVEETFKCVRHS